MNCEICDKILDHIKNIDKKVIELKDQHEASYNKFVYDIVGGVNQETIDKNREECRKNLISMLKSQKEQILTHKGLTQHYKEEHLLKRE